MRRREKFIIASLVLSIGLLGVQYVGISWRYLAIGILILVSYWVSAWALADDLQPHEWLTIVPFPALYAGSVGLFYFLLPTNIISRILVLVLFAIGMYALFLTANIYSVAKGRNIQLLYAAHAVGLYFTLLTSLLFTNTIFSLKLPFWQNALLVGVAHFPLILMSLWSINLKDHLGKEELLLSGIVTLILIEFAVIFSLIPLPAWHVALFIMGLVYIGLGILQSFIKGRLFRGTINEYSLVATFLLILFLVLVPWK